MMITLRTVTPEDLPFLRRLYASARLAELASIGWDAAATDAFLAMQFRAQHEYYQQHYAGADFNVILVHSALAGRLYVARRRDEIRVIDITLLPEQRGRGIGELLLRNLLAEGSETGAPVTLHVERNSRARALYLRLGFQKIGASGPYDLMEWRSER